MPIYPMDRQVVENLKQARLHPALRRWALSTGCSGLVVLGLGGLGAPAHALEQIVVPLPLLQTSFTVKLADLRNPSTLLSGNSDLAQLDQATNGDLGRKLVGLVNTPLPLEVTRFTDTSVGSPLLNQALMIVSAIFQVKGVPQPIDSQELAAVFNRAAAKGSPTLLDVLEAIPGQSATLDLEQAVLAADRLIRQQAEGERLVKAIPTAAIDPALTRMGPRAIKLAEQTIRVAYRPQPLSIVSVMPTTGANGRLVVISHGLWDDPESFQGWAKHLASHGYTVLIPRHPGSDLSQQRSMLAGETPPPSPEDLILRPMDISAAIDAAAKGTLTDLPANLRTDDVVGMGQSWGATDMLQLAGAQPSNALMIKRCPNLSNPARNLSWVLQCSFLKTANRAGRADPRIKAVMVVSPVTSLLFNVGSAGKMNARVLLVSGTHDWVVPSGPEALIPMAQEARNVGGGHQVVLAKGGTHFNLRATLEQGGGPLGALLLAWTNGAFAAGPAAAPGPNAPLLLPPDGWGDSTYPLVNVTTELKTRPIPASQ
ncbi:alpha/beta hydrolase family protein [Cyanobium sp. ULC082]